MANQEDDEGITRAVKNELSHAPMAATGAVALLLLDVAREFLPHLKGTYSTPTVGYAASVITAFLVAPFVAGMVVRFLLSVQLSEALFGSLILALISVGFTSASLHALGFHLASADRKDEITGYFTVGSTILVFGMLNYGPIWKRMTTDGAQQTFVLLCLPAWCAIVSLFGGMLSNAVL